jgi:CheY-like chemotaxis protein
VTLWFPRASETVERIAEGRAAPPETRRPGAGKRLLVVDDDAMVRAMLVAQLKNAGYQIAEASDGLGALACLDENNAVDALVTDLSMPGMNGLVLIEEVRRRQPGLPTMLLTGYADANIALDFDDRTHDHMLLMRKPVSGDDLVRAVAALIGPKLDARN